MKTWQVPVPTRTIVEALEECSFKTVAEFADWLEREKFSSFNVPELVLTVDEDRRPRNMVGSVRLFLEDFPRPTTMDALSVAEGRIVEHVWTWIESQPGQRAIDVAQEQEILDDEHFRGTDGEVE